MEISDLYKAFQVSEVRKELRILTFGNASGIEHGAIEGLTMKLCDAIQSLKQ